MANTRKRNKKTKRTATKRRSLRGIRGNRGSHTFLADFKDAAIGVGSTAGGVMATHGLVHNLLKDKDGHFVLSPKDKNTQVPDDKIGGGLTGLGLALVSAVGLTQVENPYLRDALKGAGGAALEIGITSYMSNLKDSLGLKGIAGEPEYDGSPEDSIDWESIAAEAMQEVQGIDEDGEDDDEASEYDNEASEYDYNE